MLKWVDCDDGGIITAEDIARAITPRTKFVAVTQMSNVTATVLPIKEIVKVAHERGIPGFPQNHTLWTMDKSRALNPESSKQSVSLDYRRFCLAALGDRLRSSQSTKRVGDRPRSSPGLVCRGARCRICELSIFLVLVMFVLWFGDVTSSSLHPGLETVPFSVNEP